MVNVVFNGLYSYHFMLLMRTNPQGRTLGGILLQNICKLDAELILRQTEHY